MYLLKTTFVLGLLLSITNPLKANAQEDMYANHFNVSANIAKTCSYVEKMRDVDFLNDLIESDPDREIYSVSFGPYQESITPKDYKNLQLELIESRNQMTSLNFRERLLNNAIQKSLEKKRGLYLISELTHLNEKVKESEDILNGCFYQDSRLKHLTSVNNDIKNTKFNREYRKLFLTMQLENVIRIRLLLDDLEKLEKKKKEMLIKHGSVYQSTGSNSMPIITDSKEKPKILGYFNPIIKQRYEQISLLNVDSGILLDISNKTQYIPFIPSSHYLKLSKIGEQLFSLIKNEDYKKIKEDLGLQSELYDYTNPSLPVEIDVSSVSISMVKNISNEKDIVSWIQKNTKKQSDLFLQELNIAINNEILMMNDSTLQLCKKAPEIRWFTKLSSEQQLHHYESLVNYTIGQNLVKPYQTEDGKKLGPNPLSKLLLIQDIGSYCYLEKHNPRKIRKSFDKKTIAAIGASIAGFYMIKSRVLAKPGIVLFGAGSGYLALTAGYTWYLENLFTKTETALSYGGWLNFSNVLQHLDQRRDAAFNTMLATSALGPLLPAMVLGTPRIIANTRMHLASSGSEKVRDAKYISRFSNAKRTQRWLKQKEYQKLRNSVLARFTKYNHNSPDIQRSIRMWSNFKDWLKGGAKVNFASLPFLNLLESVVQKQINPLFRMSFSLQKGSHLVSIHKKSARGKKLIKAVDDIVYNPKPDIANQELLLGELAYFAEGPIVHLKKTMDKGIQAMERLPVLRREIAAWDSKTRSLSQPKTIVLPIVEDAVVIKRTESKPIWSLGELEKLEQEALSLAKYTFPRTSHQITTRQAATYDFYDQITERLRLLTYAEKELARIDNKSELQSILLADIGEILKKNNSRADSELLLLKQEVYEEIAELFRSQKTKIKNYGQEEFSSLNAATQARIKQSNFLADIVNLRTMGALVAAGGVSATIFDPFWIDRLFDEGRILRAEIEVFTRNLFRNDYINYNKEEYDCAFSSRSFSFMVCFNEQAKKEFAVEIAEAEAKNEVHLLANDTDWKVKIRSYSHKMISLRRKFRGAEFFHLSNSILEQDYEDSAKIWFANYIANKENGSRAISTFILKIFATADTEERANLLQEFEDNFGERYIGAIEEFVASPEKQKSNFKESMRLTRQIENAISNYDMLKQAKLSEEEEMSMANNPQLNDSIQNELENIEKYTPRDPISEEKVDEDLEKISEIIDRDDDLTSVKERNEDRDSQSIDNYLSENPARKKFFQRKHFLNMAKMLESESYSEEAIQVLIDSLLASGLEEAPKAAALYDQLFNAKVENRDLKLILKDIQNNLSDTSIKSLAYFLSSYYSNSDQEEELERLKKGLEGILIQ